MKKLNFILFLVCAGLTVANWNAGNQGGGYLEWILGHWQFAFGNEVT